MPAAVAIPAIASVAGAGLGLIGASKATSATTNAAHLQAQEAERAAQLQAQTAQQQLAFTRQQAGVDMRNNATSQLANYRMANAKTQRLNTLGAILGMPAQQMPAAPQLLEDEASGRYNPYDGTLGAAIGVR